MKYIISSGTSVISGTTRMEDTIIAFTAIQNSDSARKYDTYGDAMKVCIGVNNLVGKPAYKVDFIEG